MNKKWNLFGYNKIIKQVKSTTGNTLLQQFIIKSVRLLSGYNLATDKYIWDSSFIN